MGPESGISAAACCSHSRVFAALAWRKLRIVRALQPEPRWDAPLERLRSVAVNGLLQRRMVLRDWRPGVMHAVIFIGFLSLLLRKLHLIAIGFDESASFPDAFGGPFAAFKDGIEIAVTAAVLYALHRRFVPRPARLERNREAVLVLGLILAIMVTDFAFDGFRFALLAERFPQIAHERSWAFAGSAIASAVSGLSQPALEVGYGSSTGPRWWSSFRSSSSCRSASTSTSSPRCRRSTSGAADRATACRPSISTSSWKPRTSRK